MNTNDYLKLVVQEDEKSEKLLRIIMSNIKENNLKRASENYKALGKRMIFTARYKYAVDWFREAAELNGKIERFQSEIEDRLNIVEALKNTNDKFGMAQEYNRIAGIYSRRLNKRTKASTYYRLSAICHEEYGNYFAAHKMAWSSYKSLDKKSDNQVAMLNLAIRNSIKQSLHNKTIFYIDELLSIIDVNHESSHYFSVVKKGYHAAVISNDHEHIAKYLKEIIIAHIESGTEQRNIKQYTKEYLISALIYNRKWSREFDEIISVIHTNYNATYILYSNLARVADDNGIEEVVKLKFMSYESKKKYMRKNKNIIGYLGLQIWKLTSVYGESLKRWSDINFC